MQIVSFIIDLAIDINEIMSRIFSSQATAECYSYNWFGDWY